MGLRRIGGALALALLVGACAGCSDDRGRSDDIARRRDDRTTTAHREDGETDGERDVQGDALGGSRYLVVNDRDDDGLPRLVRRDLVAGTEEVVDEPSGDRTYTGTTVDAAGTVAWSEWDDGRDEAVVIRPAEGPIVRVDDRSAACPRWLPDGRLLVVIGAEGDRELAAVDPASGATDEVFAVDVGEVPQCPSPAGSDAVVLARPLGGEPYGPEGAQVVRAPLGGTDERVLGTVPGGCWPLDVAGSFDGERVAAGVVCEDARLTGLYVGSAAVDLELVFGRNEDADPTFAEVEVHPAWSADGSLVAFDRGDQSSGRTESTLWTVAWPDGEAAPLDEEPSALAALSPPEAAGRD